MNFSKIASGLSNVLTGGLADTVYDAIKTYFPPDMPMEEKGKIMLDLKRLELEKKQQSDQVLLDAEREITQRISELEGTAKDLRSLPIVGRMVLFARGSQRPIWGFYTIWLDYQWFTSWTLSEYQQKALIAINLLVLGFLFGERAVKNVAPWLIQAIEKRKESA
ncbi:hypothetical protein GZ77_21135 [Endozoicomonas montiporae]|uniref:Coil containing protein n=2 Tax=Endozoicomonas montiporae TaxID=1027273 RepID=A0A081N3B5_9GAMM|nr:hypothetical protein [Endozoicomonas montiporae]AMO58235.1 hypothetical protein EZMO1_4318 [Endozoicomonas montiporae CL-33]KEQ12938.1 hypothetical protein GZ77_21135 [Endozoicomonas montiporae]